jgi:hypothetical protein
MSELVGVLGIPVRLLVCLWHDGGEPCLHAPPACHRLSRSIGNPRLPAGREPTLPALATTALVRVQGIEPCLHAPPPAIALVGKLGIEPRLPAPKAGVLPLYYFPA